MRSGTAHYPLPVAVVLAATAGAILAVCRYLDSHNVYSSVPGTLAVVAYLLGVGLFPAAVSFVARRSYFWWGLASAVLFVAAGFLSFVIWPPITDYPPVSETIWVYVSYDLTNDVSMALAGALVFAGPVSLIRWRAERRRSRSVANSPARGKPASSRESGVWPPAPKGE